MMLPQPSSRNLVYNIQNSSRDKNRASALRLRGFLHENGFLHANRSLIADCLVSMFCEIGSIPDAQKSFDMLDSKSESAWSSLIIGYLRCGQISESFTLLEEMKQKSLHPSARTFVALLKACSKLKDLQQAIQVHAHLSAKELDRNLFIASALVDTYAKCGALAKAQEAFDILPHRDVVVWTALIAAYVEQKRGQEALDHFKEMQCRGVLPNSVTYACSLKACGIIRAKDKGIEIHEEISMKGLIAKDLVLAGAIVDMYVKCGMLKKAREVFNGLPIHDGISWNVLVTGYAQDGHGEEAWNCFQQMQLEGYAPDVVTYSSCLKACGSIKDRRKGKELHAEILRKGLLERHTVLNNALLDMYAKCGLLTKAQEVFDKIQVRNVVSWTALIAGYVEHDRGDDALICFEQMQSQGINPNAVTFACSLKACSMTGSADKGIQIHAEVARMGLLKADLILGNTLVDMYAKCGMLTKSQEVFDCIPKHNVVSWTSLMTGYAQVGEIENVHSIFQKMRDEGSKPNPVTFVSVLNACSHVGWVDKGQTYFEAMSKAYGITPTLEHLSCMVDLLCRAGQLNLAVVMLNKTPFHPSIVMWLTVLAGCRKWGNVELGRHAFQQVIRMDEEDDSAYLCMYNIFVDAGMDGEAQCIEAMRVGRKAHRERRHCV